MPEISIIVPIYKVEKYLHECVDSIINQSFTDIEVILVDDGSPDNCGRICDEYSKKDYRIQVIHQTNGGLSNARNTGIKHAKGQYIAFVDSDDFIDTEYCERLYNILKDTEYDFSVCNVQRFHDGNYISPLNESETLSVYNNIEFLSMQVNKKSEFGVWNKLYKRSIFEKIAFADGKINEDVIFSADLAAYLSNGVICTNQKLYFYRQREGSIVSNQKTDGIIHFIDAANHLIEMSENYYRHLYKNCVEYAIKNPWTFVDRIIVKKKINNNIAFLVKLQTLIKNNIKIVVQSDKFNKIQKYRMKLFSKSIYLYSLNAYLRLFRVYLYRIINKDPYKDGHGI